MICGSTEGGRRSPKRVMNLYYSNINADKSDNSKENDNIY